MKFNSMKSMGVYYRYFKVPRSESVKQVLEYITFKNL